MSTFARLGLDSVFPVSELLFELPYSGNALRVNSVVILRI